MSSKDIHLRDILEADEVDDAIYRRLSETGDIDRMLAGGDMTAWEAFAKYSRPARKEEPSKPTPPPPRRRQPQRRQGFGLWWWIAALLLLGIVILCYLPHIIVTWRFLTGGP